MAVDGLVWGVQSGGERKYVEGIEVIEGANKVGFSITTAIVPWYCWTWVELNPIVLLVLGSRGLGELIVGLKQIIILTP